MATTAQVDQSAFVGPEAQVRENARVTENARIEHRAIIAGNALVTRNATVRGYAWVMGEARVTGSAIVEDFAGVYAGELTEDARVGALTVVADPAARVSGAGGVRGLTNGLFGVEVGREA